LPSRIGRLLYITEEGIGDLRSLECKIRECWSVGGDAPKFDSNGTKYISWDDFLNDGVVPDGVADCALLKMRDTRLFSQLQILHRIRNVLQAEGKLFLYVERERRWKSIRIFEEELTKIGFSHVRGFALLPPYNCSSISLPLEDGNFVPEALDQLWLHKGKTFWNRAKLIILQVLNEIGLGRLVCRSVLYIARKRQKQDNMAPERLSRNDASARPPTSKDPKHQMSKNIVDALSHKMRRRDLTIGVYPGHRKFIMPMYSQDEILGYAKLFQGREVEAGLNEAEMLKRLACYDFKTAEVPQILAEIEDKEAGQYALVISTKEGLRNFRALSGKHIDWLVELFNTTSVSIAFEESEYYSTVKAQLSRVLSYGKYFWLEDLIDKAIADLVECGCCPLGVAQREFPYFHALRSHEGLFVIDWELADGRYPPYFDLYHGLLSSCGRMHNDPLLNYVAKVTSLFFSRDNVRDTVIDYGQRIGLSNRLSYSLFTLYLLDQCAIHLRWDETDTMVKQKIEVLNLLSNESRYSRSKWLWREQE
jgi:hypothetical protein